MAEIFMCGQNEILGDQCVSCGGWLNRVQLGGFAGPRGWRFCDLDCIDAQIEHDDRLDIQHHLTVRDLLCECGVCREHGLPTQAMRGEYMAYREATG